MTVGVVDAISGISNCHVQFTGEADHAGGTPMYDRQDALVAAGGFLSSLDRPRDGDGVLAGAIASLTID